MDPTLAEFRKTFGDCGHRDVIILEWVNDLLKHQRSIAYLEGQIDAFAKTKEIINECGTNALTELVKLNLNHSFR